MRAHEIGAAILKRVNFPRKVSRVMSEGLVVRSRADIVVDHHHGELIRIELYVRPELVADAPQEMVEDILGEYATDIARRLTNGE